MVVFKEVFLIPFRITSLQNTDVYKPISRITFAIHSIKTSIVVYNSHWNLLVACSLIGSPRNQQSVSICVASKCRRKVVLHQNEQCNIHLIIYKVTFHWTKTKKRSVTSELHSKYFAKCNISNRIIYWIKNTFLLTKKESRVALLVISSLCRHGQRSVTWHLNNKV